MSPTIVDSIVALSLKVASDWCLFLNFTENANQIQEFTIVIVLNVRDVFKLWRLSMLSKLMHRRFQRIYQALASVEVNALHLLY